MMIGILDVLFPVPEGNRNADDMGMPIHRSGVAMANAPVRPEFSEGICGNGAVILKDGKPMTITQILACLKALDFLLEVKEHKDSHGSDDWYQDAEEIAWTQAKNATS